MMRMRKSAGKAMRISTMRIMRAVHPASEIARANPYKGAEGDGNENYEKPDGEGYSGAVNHSGENVAAVLVGAENKSSRDPVLRSCKFFQRDGFGAHPLAVDGTLALFMNRIDKADGVGFIACF